MTIAVLCATDGEARPLMERTGAKPYDGSVCPVFSGCLKGAQILIAVSGMGAGSAAAACRHLVEQHGATTVVNLGLCGALAEGLKPGEVVTADAVIDADHVTSSDPGAGVRVRPWPGLPCRRLGTVTKPVFDSSRRDGLATQCGVVDMEGFAVATACRELGVPCLILKGVSDEAGEGGRGDLHRNLDAVSRSLAERFVGDWDRVRAPTARGVLSRMLHFTRVEHTVFSLPLLFAGAWIGAGYHTPSWRVLGLIAVVGTGARTFGMAMNRILDRDIDAENPRTADRELPSGGLSLVQGYVVALAGIAVYLLGCAGLGRLCLILSPAPLIPLAAYALLKRFTALCHFGIGLCLATAPLGAFVAASSRLPAAADVLLLSAFTFFWISGFDIIYALQDIESDRALGVKSIPAALGSGGAQGVAAACHLVSVALLMTLWMQAGHAVVPGLALVISAGAFAAAYVPRIPLPQRFFPLSAIAGVAGALVIILNGLG